MTTISQLPPLNAKTDLYLYAKHAYAADRVPRYLLFKLPAFVNAFRALPRYDQLMLWESLRISRKNHNHHSTDTRVVATFTPQDVVDDWFLEFCRSPSTFDFEDHIWRLGQCCPEVWLREQFAARMEVVKVTQLPPTKSYHGPSTTKPGAINKRMRTAWQGVLSPIWLHACEVKLIGELSTMDYQAWLGPVDGEAQYPMLLIHEKNLQRGTFPKTRTACALLAHPVSIEQAKGRVRAARGTKLRKPMVNPGRDAQIAALKQDSSARVNAHIQADLALIAMGGTLKQLRAAMGARIGHKPRLGSVIAYLKFVILAQHPMLDSRVIGPEYNGLFVCFSSKYENARNTNSVGDFKGMMPELGMLNLGPGFESWTAKTSRAIKKILPRT